MNLNPSDIRTLVHAVTKRTGVPVHDEDLEQQAALNALEAFHRLNHVRHPHALLMKIVQDTVRDHWRRRRPSTEDLSEIDERRISHAPSFEIDLDSHRRLDLLRRALARLPAPTRLLLDLFYTHDHSIAQIAHSQGRTTSAVKMELVRARQTLARIIRSLATKKSH
ncbi:MAG: sigma-70 family RNA polymerase sigma factor [Acidobacteria bacterium]|nr:sigma-70 family RNA polymerase sigma factor [Acidobacteriota bacterium]